MVMVSSMIAGAQFESCISRVMWETDGGALAMLNSGPRDCVIKDVYNIDYVIVKQQKAMTVLFPQSCVN